jgi:hypothetical protein
MTMEAHLEICGAIDSYREIVTVLSHEIHEHPELKFEEHFASDPLTRAVCELGLKVETGVGGLKSAFRAEFCRGDGPTVALRDKYSATNMMRSRLAVVQQSMVVRPVLSEIIWTDNASSASSFLSALLLLEKGAPYDGPTWRKLRSAPRQSGARLDFVQSHA